MRRLILSVAAAFVALAPSQLVAQTLDPVEQVRLTGVGDGVVATWDNVYIGPYEGVLLSDPTQPALTLFCVDFAHGVSVGNTWYVNVTGLSGSPDLSETRLSSEYSTDPVASVVRYRQAAFLASLFATNTGRSNYSGIHAAIWRIMTPGFPNLPGVNSPSTALSLAQPWLAMAEQAADDGFTGMNWAEWRVLSDVSADGHNGGKQEYLTRVAVVTPEPETWALMITGLLVLGFFARRRIRELGDLA